MVSAAPFFFDSKGNDRESVTSLAKSYLLEEHGQAARMPLFSDSEEDHCVLVTRHAKTYLLDGHYADLYDIKRGEDDTQVMWDNS
jgi:hypothetical protein